MERTIERNKRRGRKRGKRKRERRGLGLTPILNSLPQTLSRLINCSLFQSISDGPSILCGLSLSLLKVALQFPFPSNLSHPYQFAFYSRVTHLSLGSVSAPPPHILPLPCLPKCGVSCSCLSICLLLINFSGIPPRDLKWMRGWKGEIQVDWSTPSREEHN